MAILNNLADLEKFMNNSIKSALANEVNETVRQTLKENIESEVYDKYTPQGKNPYQRTGGLLEDKNIESTFNGNELIVRSVRRSEDGRDIAEVIESGEGYTWTSSTIYDMQPFPRPFHATTAQELQSTQKHTLAMARGLRRQGIKVDL